MSVVSAPDVRKIPFSGTLGTRDLYLYLPPDFANQTRRYPLLMMQDGQNCFETFAEDAFSGTWQADLTADRLIREGVIQPCLIVGVSHGKEQRLEEYLPPYSHLRPELKPRRRFGLRRTAARRGKALELLHDYRQILRLLQRSYRAKAGREHIATCGSSMGGLFSAYLAFEHPDFAKRHGVLSASFWMTRTRSGTFRMLEHWQHNPVHDVRVWLDSGGGEGGSDDNSAVTRRARRALTLAGYREGEHFVYHHYPEGLHSEHSWAARFPEVLRYLMPAKDVK